MSKTMKILILLVVVLFVAYPASLMFRYIPVGSASVSGGIYVWDRWENRVCFAVIGRRLACNLNDLSGN
jgi:hypothetical protein